MEFSYDGYKNLISLLQKNNYSFASYYNYKKFDKCVIMRHDIDSSLDKAVSLAELEQNLGVRSTYFVLISSPFYNIISREARRKINAILNAGHEIGLHFDESNYDQQYYKMVGGVEKALLKEVELMQNILQMGIKSVSMHRPSKKTLEANYDLPGIVNSYGKEFFCEFKYISDSRGCWREDVNNIILTGGYKRLHILTHALLYDHKEKNIKETIMEFIENAKAERYDNLNQNMTDLEGIIRDGK